MTVAPPIKINPKGSAPVGWPDMDARLRELAKDKLSAAQIAPILYSEFNADVSRNAVLGYCSRRGIQLSGAPSGPRGPRTPRNPAAPRPPQPERTPNPAPIAFPMHDFPPLDAEPMLGYEPTHLLDAKHDQCRWIDGDASEGLCCGRRQKLGSSFCLDHHHRAYQPAKKRSPAQIAADDVRRQAIMAAARKRRAAS